MRHINIFILICLSVFVSCTQNEQNSTKKETKSEGTPLDSATSTATLKLIENYLPLKEAMVATSEAQIRVNGKQFTEALWQYNASVDSNVLISHGSKVNVDSMLQDVALLQSINDTTCEQQRLVFKHISNQLYDLLQHLNFKNARIYRQYCPMAFNDEGAYWLSDTTEIRNPYFGKIMLECGEVSDSL